ncbi:MAG: fatty acid desaturase [Gemmatimonadota bacterium]|nr:fatty acid desaturase [Gemmatimonadota bacterium]
MIQSAPGVSRAASCNEMLAPYNGPDHRRSLAQLLLTATGFFVLWYVMLRSLEVHYALTLLLSLPTAGFLVRLFMIQHDCGHGSFFRSRRLSSVVGHAIGTLTLLPYEYWRRTHALHHAHAGDLEHRGFGDVETLTVEEYLGRSKKERLAYRIYRNPLVLFGVGALWHFVLKQRLPLNIPRGWTREWRSVWITNFALAASVLVMVALVGLPRFLLVHAPVVAVTCSVGVWLFYVQHQFEDTYWERPPEWDFFDAALEGSSHLVLPRPLAWLTAHIGLHHIHHLNPRIPNYRLQACQDDLPVLEAANKISIRGSWAVTRLHLWDGEARRLISFRELGARAEA